MNKRFDNWIRNQGPEELIDELMRSRLDIRGSPIITVNSGSNEIRGTYVHRKLITHIASWISPAIAIKVSDIVKEYLLKEQRKLIAEKDDTISELNAKLDAILEDSWKDSQT